MKKRFCWMIAIMILFMLICQNRQSEAETWNTLVGSMELIGQETAGNQEPVLNDSFIDAIFLSNHGDISLLLKKGFDFIDKDSSTLNYDLALTAVTLSGQVYDGAGAAMLLKRLGYDQVTTTTPMLLDADNDNTFLHPVSSMGYKHITDANGNEKNIFAIVVRGTSNPAKDIPTDLLDGAVSMFDASRGNVVGDLEDFIRKATGKTIDALKNEDNYFFITGHSLGGAVANALSVDETVTSLCGDNKGHIYTYTFESPHTCVNLIWMHVDAMSNAYNYKDKDDGVTNLPPYMGATTYGTDVMFSVNDLHNNIFVNLFPLAKCRNVVDATATKNYGSIMGHHDRGLDLVFIIQTGIAAGWWEDMYKIDGVISMWPQNTVYYDPVIERTSAYNAYLSLLEEEKGGIDNYIWQKGYTLLYNEDDSELLPLTDDLLARPVAICDVYGDATPELIFVGKVEPGEGRGVYYWNDSPARLHIVTYQNGKLVTLYEDEVNDLDDWDYEDYWDSWGDSWNGYHFFQVNGSKDLYATLSNGDLSFWDYVFRFTEGSDGKLHKEQICLFWDDEEDGELYYSGQDQRISKEEYHSMLLFLSENTTTVLMYSQIRIKEFRGAVEQHDCIAMTCDEAIAWLEKRLNFDPSSALDKEMSEAPWVYNNNLAVSCAVLSLSVYSGPSDSGIKVALSNYGFSDENIISNNYGRSLAYTIAIKDYTGKDAAKGEKLIVTVAQGTTNPYEMLRDIISNTDTSLRGYPVYSIVREFKQAICEDFDKCGWQTGKYKILITGHSLGGAAANYLAATLIDELPGQLEKEDIYCYTFAAINSIASDHPVNIYNMYDTFSPEHFGSSLVSGMGGGYGKFGHMDIYRKDHRSDADANKAAPVQIMDHINHDMDKYMYDVNNGLIQCSSDYQAFVTINGLKNKLSIWKAPNKDSGRHAYAYNGDVFELLAVEGDWYRIRYNGKIGYVTGEHVFPTNEYLVPHY